MPVRMFLLLPLLLWASFTVAGSDPEPDLTPRQADNSAEVAAIVNDEPITIGEVNELVASVLQGRPVNPAALAQVQAEVLAQLIDRTVILQFLKSSGKLLPDSVIDQAMAELKKQATERKVDFDKMLVDRKLTQEQFRKQLVWQLNWGQYAQTALKDSTLKTYFEIHRREFDGSEVRVSHILLPPDDNSDVQETERLKRRASKLREQITSGKISFEDAAAKFSSGPSRHKGGDMGFIPRSGMMLEPFAAAAFKLDKGKLSEPVVTSYGVHLIKVTDIKPGHRTWVESKEQLRAPATQDLFEKLAAKERDQAHVTFTGKIPHFRIGTHELVKGGS